MGQLPFYQPIQSQQSQRFIMNNNHINNNELEQKISLLEERLVVNRSQQKVGEILVRKQIETRIVEVPLRREILLIEQVEPENKLLATIDLEEDNLNRFIASNTVTNPTEYVVRGEFNSLEAASRILHQMNQIPSSDRQKVKIEIVVDNSQQQTLYQQALLNQRNN